MSIQKSKKWFKPKKPKKVVFNWCYNGVTLKDTYENSYTVNHTNRDRIGGYQTLSYIKMDKNDYGNAMMGKSRKFFKRHVNSQLRLKAKREIAQELQDYLTDYNQVCAYCGTYCDNPKSCKDEALLEYELDLEFMRMEYDLMQEEREHDQLCYDDHINDSYY